MIPAQLIKELEKEGFDLNFPAKYSNEEKIIKILHEGNERLKLALPLLLRYDFDYRKIILKLNKEQLAEFNKILIITARIFKNEDIENTTLNEIIIKGKLRCEIKKSEFDYYYSSFKDYKKNSEEKSEQNKILLVRDRSNLNTNMALSKIFSPAKMRIMENIFNREPLTNTELKYYYGSIRPLIKSITNENLQDYVRIVDSLKKRMN